MEDGEIPDIQISASSEWSDNHAASQGRLNYKATTVKEGGWSAGLGDLNKWLQIDLGNRATTVTSVATQGRNNHGQWVTKYRLQYSNDGFNFKFYKERGEEDSKVRWPMVVYTQLSLFREPSKMSTSPTDRHLNILQRNMSRQTAFLRRAKTHIYVRWEGAILACPDDVFSDINQ